MTGVVIYINGEEIGHASHNLPRADLPGNFAYTYSWDTSRWSGQNVNVRARIFSGDKYFDREKTVFVGFKVGQDAVRSDVFNQAFDRNGKEANMGWPYERVHWDKNFQVQGFDGGAYGSCAIIHDINSTDANGKDVAWIVRGAIGAKYTIVGENYTAGPRSDERPADSSKWSTGRVQNFRQGVICSSPVGVSMVINDIFNKYLSVGASGGVLGFPGSDHYGVERTSGFRQNFEGGNIFQSEFGVFVMVDRVRVNDVADDIRKRFFAAGAEQGPFGLVTSDEYEITSFTGKKGREQNFVGGNIFFGQYGVAMLLNGSIRDRYYALKAQQGPLGLVESDEYGITSSTKKTAQRQNFEGGNVYHSEFGTFVMLNGSIRDQYHHIYNAELGKLGLPVSDAFPYQGGMRQNFEGGFLTTMSANRAPVLAKATFNLTQNVAFSARLAATDADKDRLTYKVVKGTLPVGLRLYGNGSLRGTPTVIGSNIVKIEVFDGKGGTGSANLTINVTAPPVLPAPLLLSATGEAGQVRLSWDDRAKGETGYKIERLTNGRWSLIARGTTPNQTSYLDENLTAGVSYSYRVSAYISGVAVGRRSNVASAKALGSSAAAMTAAALSAGAG